MQKDGSHLGASAHFLMAMPGLQAFTDILVHFLNLHRRLGWDFLLDIPPSLREQVTKLNLLTKEWPGWPFFRKDRKASAFGLLHSRLGATRCTDGSLRPGGLEGVSHTPHKHQGTFTVQSLALPGETVGLAVDNFVTISSFDKERGSKTTSPCTHLPFLRWCMG